MRVLFVYKYLTLGGVETVLRARLEGLLAHGIEAEAWFLSDGIGRILFRGMESLVRVGGINDLQRYLDGWPKDLVATIDTEEVFPALAAFSRHVPVVLELHSPYRENRVYLRWLDRLSIRALWVPSRYQAEVVARSFPHLPYPRVIPNPLRSAFVEERQLFSPPPPLAVVAWIGRLDGLKNWGEFLRIGGLILKDGGDVEFWIVGNAPRFGPAADLLRKAKRAGVMARFKWLPSLPHSVMPRLLDAVRESGGVLVSTSRGESFGMTIAEGMARRCPVVVPALGPFPEYVRDGENGLCYRPGSVQEAAHCVAALLSDAALRRRLGENARRDILALCGPENALAILARELAIAAQPPAGPSGPSG
jgi:glycosyltransferase involved in cell wall biosynthesis